MVKEKIIDSEKGKMKNPIPDGVDDSTGEELAKDVSCTVTTLESVRGV